MPAPHNSSVIDSLEFARKELAIHDTILVSQFSRLHGALASDSESVEYELVGGMDAEGRPRLYLKVTGGLQLICQRCLEPFEFKLDIASSFIIARDEDAIPADADELDDADYLIADVQMSVLALIEDEILLALPLAPKHGEDQCSANSRLNELKKPSPFAALEALKTGKSQN